MSHRPDDEGNLPAFTRDIHPLAARDARPDSLGLVRCLRGRSERPGKHDRKGVRIRLAGEIVTVNMMTWPDSTISDCAARRCGALVTSATFFAWRKVGPEAAYEYYVEVIPRGTSQHPVYLALCRQSVRNSVKKYGYY